MPSETSTGFLDVIPQDSKTLIELLDQFITVPFSMEDLGSETKRLQIAFLKGKRDLVNCLVNRLETGPLPGV